MTVCNMTIEAGARAGIVAVDDKTIDYVKGRPYAPRPEQWEQAVADWRDAAQRRGGSLRQGDHASTPRPSGRR